MKIKIQSKQKRIAILQTQVTALRIRSPSPSQPYRGVSFIFQLGKCTHVFPSLWEGMIGQSFLAVRRRFKKRHDILVGSTHYNQDSYYVKK